MYHINHDITTRRISSAPTSVTRIRHSMEDGPDQLLEKVLLYSYMLLLLRLAFGEELSQAWDEAERGPCSLFFFLLHCNHIWGLDGWGFFYFYVYAHWLVACRVQVTLLDMAYFTVITSMKTEIAMPLCAT